MPSVLGVLERRQQVAPARAEKLRSEVHWLQAALAEEDEAARRAVIAHEETVAALAEAADEVGAVGVPVELPAAGAVAVRLEVPMWREGVGIEVPCDCARIVALVRQDAAGGGEGARAMRSRCRARGGRTGRRPATWGSRRADRPSARPRRSGNASRRAVGGGSCPRGGPLGALGGQTGPAHALGDQDSDGCRHRRHNRRHRAVDRCPATPRSRPCAPDGRRCRPRRRPLPRHSGLPHRTPRCTPPLTPPRHAPLRTVRASWKVSRTRGAVCRNPRLPGGFREHHALRWHETGEGARRRRSALGGGRAARTHPRHGRRWWWARTSRRRPTHPGRHYASTICACNPRGDSDIYQLWVE